MFHCPVTPKNQPFTVSDEFVGKPRVANFVTSVGVERGLITSEGDLDLLGMLQDLLALHFQERTPRARQSQRFLQAERPLDDLSAADHVESRLALPGPGAKPSVLASASRASR